MDDETERVINNEQEWRRVLYTDIRETKKRIGKLERCLDSMMVWQKVYRFIFAGAISSIFAYIKHKLGGA